MKISHRLLALAALSAAGLVCVAAVSAWSVTSIQTDLRALTTRAAPLQNHTYELQERTERVVGGLLKLSLSRSREEAGKAGTELGTQLQDIQRLRQQLAALDGGAARTQSLDLKAVHQEIAAAVEDKLSSTDAYRERAEQTRAALKVAEDAVARTRSTVQQIGVEAGKAADRAQDGSRRLAQGSKLMLAAQTRLKELTIVIGEVDVVSSRFRLGPLKERAKATTDSIARLEVENGSDDPLKEVRGIATAAYDAIARDGTGLLALRAAVLAAKPEGKAEAEAAYQKQRKALTSLTDEQAGKLGTLIDANEVQGVKLRQMLEGALKLRNEPGGVVTTSEEVSLEIRDMVGHLRLLMLATASAEVSAAQGQLRGSGERLLKHMQTMRAGLVQMGRPQLATEVDGALKAMDTVMESMAQVAAAKDKLLASEARMGGTLDRLKTMAAAQAAEGQKQVAEITARQQQVSAGVDARVQSSLAIIVGIAAAIILTTGALSLLTVRTVTQRLDAAVHVAEQVSGGNLAAVPAAQGTDETARLINALSTMVTTLRGIVGNIGTAAQQIESGSAEINRGNADLSVRTEQQAAQLQQTAASVQQLAETVRQNAESARSANQLASGASTVAARGGSMVGDVVQTMDQIEASSKRIGEIVGVIDGIAFQTNILALNAAVEAARAGEHGRGFAVVASEVRALAGKSAAAARQVKDIVEATVQQIEGGSGLVRGAGDTMQDIVQQVQRVSHLIGEIASASEQQAESVGSVGSAVQQLDALTQHNAALAEQSTAAAASLRQQAEGLTQAVSAFRVAAA